MRGQSFVVALVALGTAVSAAPLEKRAVEVGKAFAERAAPAAATPATATPAAAAPKAAGKPSTGIAALIDGSEDPQTAVSQLLAGGAGGLDVGSIITAATGAAKRDDVGNPIGGLLVKERAAPAATPAAATPGGSTGIAALIDGSEDPETAVSQLLGGGAGGLGGALGGVGDAVTGAAGTATDAVGGAVDTATGAVGGVAGGLGGLLGGLA